MDDMDDARQKSAGGLLLGTVDQALCSSVKVYDSPIHISGNDPFADGAENHRQSLRFFPERFQGFLLLFLLFLQD